MTAHRTGRTRWLRSRPFAVVTAVLMAVLFAPAAAATTAAAASSDTLTASGYDFSTEWRADVVAGSSGNNLVFQYVAGRPLVDGTLTLDLARRDFPTPLQALVVLTGDPSEAGGVVVRPAGGFPLGPGDCTGPISWSINKNTVVQQVQVEHLDCQAGQQIKIRIFDVDAPGSTGKYRIPAAVRDTSGLRETKDAVLVVVPTPKVRLEVTTPAVLVIDTSAPITVRALNRDGTVDTGYRGWVSLLSEDKHDCTFEGYEGRPYRFTAADAGVHVFHVLFHINVATRVQAYDVEHKAVAGHSAPFQITGQATALVCPVHYH